MSEQKIVISQQQEDGSYLDLLPKVDSYSKEETLTNETSQMFGISNGTPEQIFQWLGKYNQHEWKKENIEQISKKNKVSVSHLNNTSCFSVFCCKDVIVENNTVIRPVNPQYIYQDVNSEANALSFLNKVKALAPCYLWLYWESDTRGIANVNQNVFYYLPEDITVGRYQQLYYTVDDDEGTVSYYWGIKESSTHIVGKEVENSSTISYLYSVNRNEFEDNYSSKEDSWSFVLNEIGDYSLSFIKTITYGDSVTFDGKNITIGGNTVSETLSSSVTSFNEANLKGKFVKAERVGIDSIPVYYIPSNSSILSSYRGSFSSRSGTLKFKGNVVSFKYNGNDYYNLTYMGIPFENLKNLSNG